MLVRSFGVIALTLTMILTSTGVVSAQTPRTITIEAPLPDAQATSPFDVVGHGTVTPVENTLIYRVHDAAGNVVGEGSIAVDGALGGPFTFATSVTYDVAEPGHGWLEVLEPNASGGAPFVSVTVSLDLQPSTQAELTDTLWRWVGVRGSAGTELVGSGSAQYTLRLASDGIYEGQADCNLVSGGYVVEDQDLTLHPGPTTLAFCGPLSLYNRYLDMLFRVSSYSINGDTLELVGGDAGVTMLFRADQG